MDIFIHVGGLKSHETLSSKFKLHVHAQAIFYVKKGRYETCLNFACYLGYDHS
jgi:hypothetical protein